MVNTKTKMALLKVSKDQSTENSNNPLSVINSCVFKFSFLHTVIFLGNKILCCIQRAATSLVCVWMVRKQPGSQRAMKISDAEEPMDGN